MRNKSYDSRTSFLDLLFNMLLGFVAMFVLAYSMMNINKQSKNAEAKAEFVITVTWPKEFDDDVDTYVEDPDGRLVCFKRREDGLMHLDRDDLGKRNDIVHTPFGPIEYSENREVVTLRGIVQGEYTINVHMYVKHEADPLPITVQVDKINPFSTVCVKKVILEKTGDQKTVARITINEKGLVTNVGDLYKSLTDINPYEDYSEDPFSPIPTPQAPNP